MPIVTLKRCKDCGKNLFEYIPRLTLEDSFWQCRGCKYVERTIDVNENNKLISISYDKDGLVRSQIPDTFDDDDIEIDVQEEDKMELMREFEELFDEEWD